MYYGTRRTDNKKQITKANPPQNRTRGRQTHNHGKGRGLPSRKYYGRKRAAPAKRQIESGAEQDVRPHPNVPVSRSGIIA
eukprot:767102-Hanusia_phi.AAC.12